MIDNNNFRSDFDAKKTNTNALSLKPEVPKLFPMRQILEKYYILVTHQMSMTYIKIAY